MLQREGGSNARLLAGNSQSSQNRRKAGHSEAVRSVLRRVFVGGRLMGDDLIFNLLVGGSGNNLTSPQIALGAIRAAVNNLLRIFVTDTGQGVELVFGCGIDVELVCSCG